jgi:hypothetical protein
MTRSALPDAATAGVVWSPDRAFHMDRSSKLRQFGGARRRAPPLRRRGTFADHFQGTALLVIGENLLRPDQRKREAATVPGGIPDESSKCLSDPDRRGASFVAQPATTRDRRDGYQRVLSAASMYAHCLTERERVVWSREHRQKGWAPLRPHRSFEKTGHQPGLRPRLARCNARRECFVPPLPYRGSPARPCLVRCQSAPTETL